MAVKEQTSSFEPKPFGRYVLVEKLAMGGMAEIYKAKTYGVDGFEKLLAIKRILPHCAADQEFIHMLVDEAKLTVLLSHANIVQVFDLGKVADDYFISMEFIHGTNLREIMSRYKERDERIPEEIAVYVSSELCKGLDYAHRKTDSQGRPLNIVHRDISPQNILVSYEGEVKIVDFGIAKAAMNVSHTMAGILKGKIAYMSPEQALGKPIDHRTDIFSAGVLLYEMLSGEKLFTGETQFEVLNQIRTTRINTLMLPDNIPGPLKGILAKALAYNTKDRYQTSGDFQLDLTKYLYSSFVDFSPRQLSAILSQLFEREMKKKEEPVVLDDKTRSVLIKQTEDENILIHGQTTSSVEAPMPTEKSISMTLPSLEVFRKFKSPLWIGAAGVTALLVLGYLGYRGYSRLFPEKAAVKKEMPEPAPASAPVEFGSIQVQTSPPGARIFLNDTDIGLATPATIPNLTLGEEYSLRVAKENYRERKRTLAVTSETPIVIDERLDPLPNGAIEIHSNPPGAKIFVNGQDTGLVAPNKITNLEILKNYDLKLSLANYSDWTGSIEVKDFDPVKLQASLNPIPPPPQPVPTPQPALPPAIAAVPPQAPVKIAPPPPQPAAPKTQPVREKPAPKKPVIEALPKPPEPVRETSGEGERPGSLSVDSEPAGADVFINAEFKGKTPIKVANVSPGLVKVNIFKEGFMKQALSVELKSGETKSIGMIRLGTQFGEISITSTPARADVYLDGTAIGARTPVTIRRVPRDRSHNIKIRLDGFREWESSVNLREEEKKRYDVQLEKD